ncbi:MAG TPA: hypothetical protein VGN00_14310 [Puia sp.]|jgi:hypothetical protein
MGPVSTKKLMFLLADDQDRTYYVDRGTVKKRSIPTWVKKNPSGWKDITLQFATNQKYFATLRSFSNAIKFIDDGELIIADRMLNGAGTEEIMYLIILRWDPTGGLNNYKLEYKSRLDFSQFNGDVRTGVGINTLQDDVFALVQANEDAIYSVQCNSSNPKAIPVLFDGILLQDKLNYSLLNSPIVNDTGKFWWAIPLVFVNNEGDNIDTVFNSQEFANFDNPITYCHDPANGNSALYFTNPTKVVIKGTFSFTWTTLTQPSGGFIALFMTSLDAAPDPAKVVFSNNGLGTPAFPLVPGKEYSVTINMTINLQANEKLFFIGNIADNIARKMTITPLASIVSIMFASKNDPSIAYVLRPLDLVQDLVSQITTGKYTVQSNFLASNNRKVALSGSSLRSFPDAVIQTSFSDFFQSYTAAYNLGIAVRNGVMWIEPVEDLYRARNELLRLARISKVSLTVAKEYIYTSAKVGYVKQTYNQRNGRYEFNCTHNYKFPIYTVLNQLNLVSPYRADSFGMEFIRTGYPNLNSTDDKGDADVFVAMISDSVGQTDGEVSTAVVINVETLILAAPIIKSPFTNSTVYNQNPTIAGVAQAFKTITVFVQGVQDGTTMSDENGNWSYQIQTPLQSVSLVYNGIHTISANATDGGNVSQFSNLISIVVNTSQQSAFLITSPTNNGTLYNNLPIITGIAPAGQAITLKLDGGALVTLVTNSSGIWKYQIITALADGAHVLIASSPGLPDAPAVSITVNKNVSSPLITSLAYGDILYNNRPLIKGVAISGTVVPIYLDGGGGIITGGVAAPLGTVVADVNGDWSFHVTTVFDSNNLETDFIPEGQHVFSTTPTPVNVLASITGYRLMRGSDKGPVMDYDAIKLDDAYIPPGVDPSALPPTLGQFLHPETLYNIEETTALRMLRAHDNVLNSFLLQQPAAQIAFNGAEINANLVTKKSGIIFNEGANVNVNELSQNLFVPFYLNFTTKVPFTFNDIMTAAQNGGYFPVEVNGLEIDLLPIGTMTMKPATDEAQAWKLLISGTTALSTLLKLFAGGTTINLGKNMIYFSDKNPIHIVRYNFTPAAGYHFADIYDDWQKNRFKSWPMAHPDYYQPVQMDDNTAIQAIANGVGAAELHIISIETGEAVDIVQLAPVGGSLVQLPNILLEADIEWATYPEGQYWIAVIVDGAIIGISEKLWVKVDWDDTLKVEFDESEDKIDYYFSTGIRSMIRVQGQMLLWVPDSEVDNYEDEEGDYEITRGIPLKVRNIQFGNDKSLLSDWMSLKMNTITLLENVRIENTHYTRNENSKWEAQDLGKGIPEVLILMEMILAENQAGVTFATPGDSDINSVTWTLDATAFGRNSGVINVTADQT